MIFLGRTVNRSKSYFARAAEHRAADPSEFLRRFLKGQWVKQDVQKDAKQRAFERSLPADKVTQLSRHRA